MEQEPEKEAKGMRGRYDGFVTIVFRQWFEDWKLTLAAVGLVVAGVTFLARSEGRSQKELAMRRLRLARYLRALRQIRHSKTRDQLLQRLGREKSKAGRAARFVKVRLPETDEVVLLLSQLKMKFPEQSPPRIKGTGKLEVKRRGDLKNVVKTF